MKKIEKDELYQNLSEFLKKKGVELKEGQYTNGIHAGCSLLADAINLSQAGLERARTGFERQVDQIRQVIHEKTAPKRPSGATTAAPPKPPTAAKTKEKGSDPSSHKIRRTKPKSTRRR